MKLSYKHYGRTGPPVVILHGLLGTGRNWHSIANRLIPDFQVVTPDLRNHGKSPHGEHTFDAICDDVAELVDELGWERFHLVGHSMGGAVAMKFAFQYPEWLDSLTVVDISPISHPGSMAPILHTLMDLDLTRISKKEDADEALSEKISSAMVRQFLLTNLRMTAQADYRWQCNLQELHAFVTDESRLSISPGGEFEGKTLFIGGEKSEYRIERQKTAIITHFPKAKIEIIPGAGHWVHFDAPDTFIRVLSDFLASTS